MCTRRCSRKPTAVDALALAVALLAFAPLGAAAKSGDRNQPANIESDSFRIDESRPGAKDQTVYLYQGHVVFSQGSMRGRGDAATVYQASGKPTGDSKGGEGGRVARVVLTGKPAHLEQTQDDGTVMKADADTIDYRLDTGTVDLDGHVIVVQQGRGEFRGPHIAYETKTGNMTSEGGPAGGRIHMTLEPKPAAPAAPATPAPAGDAH